jgi:hypothetical protein
MMPCGNAKPSWFLKPNFLLFTTGNYFLQVKNKGACQDWVQCGFNSNLKGEDMKNMIVAGLVAGMLAASGAWAEGAQQNRMKTCNEDAGKKSLAGDARKDFMKSCLSGATVAAPAAGGVTTQQQRMKDCNAEAKTKEMKGDARNTFMKSCWSNKKS